MIHVELSVAPHARVTPPHTIIERKFEGWDEVRKFVKDLGLRTDRANLEMVCNNPNNEYVQVELEVLEVTGRSYTAASLSIEGQAVEPPWAEARRLADLLDAFNHRIATDTNTHDGEPRGLGWFEPASMGGARIMHFTKDLRYCADVWEDG